MSVALPVTATITIRREKWRMSSRVAPVEGTGGTRPRFIPVAELHHVSWQSLTSLQPEPATTPERRPRDQAGSPRLAIRQSHG